MVHRSFLLIFLISTLCRGNAPVPAPLPLPSPPAPRMNCPSCTEFDFFDRKRSSASLLRVLLDEDNYYRQGKIIYTGVVQTVYLGTETFRAGDRVTFFSLEANFSSPNPCELRLFPGVWLIDLNKDRTAERCGLTAPYSTLSADDIRQLKGGWLETYRGQYRPWMYAAIVLLIVFLVVLCVFMITLVWWCHLRREEKPKKKEKEKAGPVKDVEPEKEVAPRAPAKRLLTAEEEEAYRERHRARQAAGVAAQRQTIGDIGNNDEDRPLTMPPPPPQQATQPRETVYVFEPGDPSMYPGPEE